MTTKEKIEKTVNSIKQKSFGNVDEDWLEAFTQGMRVAIEAEEFEYASRVCKSCRNKKLGHTVDEETEMHCTWIVGGTSLDGISDGFFMDIYDDFSCANWEKIK